MKKTRFQKKLTLEKYKPLGTQSIHGLLCVHHDIKSFVECVAVLSNKDYCHLQYSVASLDNHPLLLEDLAIGEHKKSEMHLEAMERLAAKASGSHIGIQLNTQYAAEQKFHKTVLLKLLEAVRFLGRQGLPLRGHSEETESFEGNLYQLLILK